MISIHGRVESSRKKIFLRVFIAMGNNKCILLVAKSPGTSASLYRRIIHDVPLMEVLLHLVTFHNPGEPFRLLNSSLWGALKM